MNVSIEKVPYLEFVESGHHNLGIIGVQKVPQPTGTLAQSSQDQSAVGDTLGTRCRHHNRVVRRDTRNDLCGFRERFGNKRVLDHGRFLFVGSTDPGQNDDLLFISAVLLVNAHDVQKAVNSQETRSREAGDAGVGQGNWEVVSLEAARETANADLGQDAHLTRELSLKNHTDADTLAMKDGRRQNGLDGMADTVAKVDEVTESGLALINGDNVRLDRDGTNDDG